MLANSPMIASHNLCKYEGSQFHGTRKWQCQSFTAITTTPALSAFPAYIILWYLLALGIIVVPNTNYVLFTTLPASQPLLTFPVTSRNIHMRVYSRGIEDK